MMSLLRFWALNMVVVLLSVQGQKALRFNHIILICVLKMNKGITIFGTMRGYRQNFYFWVNYPFNKGQINCNLRIIIQIYKMFHIVSHYHCLTCPLSKFIF